MNTEVVYLGHDNTIDLLLKADGTAQDLSGVTKITATFGDTLVESTDPAGGPITWNQDGYDTGEIRLALGGQPINPGVYSVPITAYDPINTDGVFWGLVLIRVQPDSEVVPFINLIDLKVELGIDLNSADQDARLILMAEAVQDLWDRLTDRKWASQDYTEIHSIPDSNVSKLFLKNYPVSNLESIKVDHNREWDNGVEPVSAEYYSLEPETGIIYLDNAFPQGNRIVQVKYTAGYLPKELPASIKQIMIRQACHWYRQAKDSGYNITSFSQIDGGSVNHGLHLLKDGLLPEFQVAAVQHRRFFI